MPSCKFCNHGTSSSSPHSRRYYLLHFSTLQSTTFFPSRSTVYPVSCSCSNRRKGCGILLGSKCLITLRVVPCACLPIYSMPYCAFHLVQIHCYNVMKTASKHEECSKLLWFRPILCDKVRGLLYLAECLLETPKAVMDHQDLQSYNCEACIP